MHEGGGVNTENHLVHPALMQTGEMESPEEGIAGAVHLASTFGFTRRLPQRERSTPDGCRGPDGVLPCVLFIPRIIMPEEDLTAV